MFKLCENPAYARNKEQSSKVLSFKATTKEVETIKEMMVYYNETYTSNLIRLALNKLYLEMESKKTPSDG